MSSPSTETMNVERREADGGDPSENASINSASINGKSVPPMIGVAPGPSSTQETNEKPQHGFRMKIHGVSPRRKRKRETTATHSMSLSGSSSSSSDEENGETKRTSLNVTAEGGHGTGSSPGQVRDSHEHETLENGVTSVASSAKRETPGNKGRDTSEVVSGTKQNEGWRVKLYRLNADGSWDDCGTGSILCLYKRTGHKGTAAGQSSPFGDAWVYQELGEPTLCMHSEVKNQSTGTGIAAPRILLRTRILLRDAYQRQGDNIITWCEPYLEEGNAAQGVDLALSFQDISGCHDIWHQITLVQSKAIELFRKGEGENSSSDGSRSRPSQRHIDENEEGNNDIGNSVSHQDGAFAAAEAHGIKRRRQQDGWVSASLEAAQHHLDHENTRADRNHDHHFEEVSMIASYLEGGSGPLSVLSIAPQSPHLPNPPGLGNLEEIADKIAAVQHMQQRESLAMFIAQNDCSYLKSLLSLFPSAESRGDYGSLATLAACVKTILLLNDPSIIELVVSDELMFEEVCSTLEYDPDLRDKANHRWFLRERAKFRTVALMEDEELVASIHRSFRVTYLRDTMLRPTMDESSLSTLSSLQTFTHTDVVKGVTVSPLGSGENGDLLKDCYLAKIIRILGREVEAVCDMEWRELENLPSDGDVEGLLREQAKEPETDRSTVVVTGKYPQSQKLSRVWKQFLAPQDNSLTSRKFRRHGCVTFLRELFNMVRTSLQQSDKDDFFAVLVSIEVDLDYEADNSKHKYRHDPPLRSERTGSGVDSRSEHDQRQRSRNHSRSVNLLALLATILADPKMDVTEKGSVLEVISGIVMHDPGLVRQRCLDSFTSSRKKQRTVEKYFDPIGPVRLHPNEKRQVILYCPADDLLGSLMFQLVMETDAGILLQVSEIMRAILDTDMMTDHGPMGVGFADEAEGCPPVGGHSPPHEQRIDPAVSLSASSNQNQFLSMFYDHYVQWLAAPFQHRILRPVCRIPIRVLESQGDSVALQNMIERFEKGSAHQVPLLREITKNAMCSSFAVELLNFCVRAHLYRMKCYVLRSRILGNILKMLYKPGVVSGERCLTLAVLRFLRSILSVNDEFYHRHIIQHNLFAPVFEAFRANPVGDNLVSSAIVEMCDFIHRENITSLITHIVTKHLSVPSESRMPSLEDVSSPYVKTLTTLRLAYEENMTFSKKSSLNSTDQRVAHDVNSHSGYTYGGTEPRPVHSTMNEKAREDQRKFREIDNEESYFDADDDETRTTRPVVPTGGVDEVAAQDTENDLLRIFSLTPAPLFDGTQRRLDDENSANHAEGVASSGHSQ